MKLVQVENGQIIKWQLPKTGYIKDGSSVSGYDKLMLKNPELAIQEGWLPLEDTPPAYDAEIQYLIDDGYEILVDKVIAKYIIKDIPIEEEIPPEPTELDVLKDENEKLKARLQATEQIAAETSSAQQELLELLIDMEVI